MTISVSSWVAVCALIGILAPVTIASIAGGFILGSAALDRASKTVLGAYVRHFFCRLAPSKFFDEDFVTERVFVERIVREAIENGRLDLATHFKTQGHIPNRCKVS